MKNFQHFQLKSAARTKLQTKDDWQKGSFKDNVTDMRTTKVDSFTQQAKSSVH